MKFYYHPPPNPAKVALFPNGKTPALVDADAVVFDSDALLALSPQNARLATATGA